jgi:hypothetical protein
VTAAAATPAMQNQDIFSVLPADGIKLLFFLEAETSERRRFFGSFQLCEHFIGCLLLREGRFKQCHRLLESQLFGPGANL